MIRRWSVYSNYEDPQSQLEQPGKIVRTAVPDQKGYTLSAHQGGGGETLNSKLNSSGFETESRINRVILILG